MTKHTEPERAQREARLQWVPVADMRIAAAAQREFRKYRAEALAADFDLERLGTPTVSFRDGHYFVIDGQHRTAALRLIGWGDQQIQCWVYHGLTEAEEADMFDHLNDVLPVSTFDRFRVRVTAGREVETDIQRTVQSQGLVISKSKMPGAIGCVGALRKCYERSDAVTLGRTLRIIRDAYGDAGLQGTVIDGISRLCERYNGQLDEPVAITKLSKVHGGVAGLLGKAEQLRRQTGNTKPVCVAAAAVEIINSGRGGKKLPSWWSS